MLANCEMNEVQMFSYVYNELCIWRRTARWTRCKCSVMCITNCVFGGELWDEWGANVQLCVFAGELRWTRCKCSVMCICRRTEMNEVQMFSYVYNETCICRQTEMNEVQMFSYVYLQANCEMNKVQMFSYVYNETCICRRTEMNEVQMFSYVYNETCICRPTVRWTRCKCSVIFV